MKKRVKTLYRNSTKKQCATLIDEENNKLYDTMGYGQFLGKCLYRNATYELVE